MLVSAEAHATDDGPRSSSYQDVLEMLGQGKTPPGIRVSTRYFQGLEMHTRLEEHFSCCTV